MLFIFSYMLLALLGMQTEVASSSVADFCLQDLTGASASRSTNNAFLCCSFELGSVLLRCYT